MDDLAGFLCLSEAAWSGVTVTVDALVALDLLDEVVDAEDAVDEVDEAEVSDDVVAPPFVVLVCVSLVALSVMLVFSSSLISLADLDDWERCRWWW